MASAQATTLVAPAAQPRPVRATTTWAPPSSGLMHTRPWRSSPLAGPAFSGFHPAIPESSEESQEDDLGEPAVPEPPRTRSPSLVSQTGSLTASGYCASGSALVLVEGDASTSSVSLTGSTVAQGTSSSHSSSQTHSGRSARLSKSWNCRRSLANDDLANASDTSIAPPPLARTLSQGHSCSVSFPVQLPAPSPTIPQIYSQMTPSEGNTTKQPLSKSRDPSSNWMSSSPFGPAQTPKFSRLAMASPAVVMPLSAKEYRKQKARESLGRGQENASSTSSHRVTFIDNALSAFQSPNGVPMVKVSTSLSKDVHLASSSVDDSADRRSQPQPQVGYLHAKPLPQASMPHRPLSPKLKRSRSRPHTPPRSSPLAAHPPISPKSSSGTFFSATSGSDDDTLPPARPRPRPRRRKSHPDRLSNGARLSLVEAMNRLSQESPVERRLSGHSQTNEVNRLSVASQASGHTLFYDAGESEVDKGQVTDGHSRHADGADRCTPVQHTQSLEDLSSALARTGIEVVRPGGDGNQGGLSDGERKGKRNVRMVRISDTVEVSPPPMSRRRKLTKSRRGSVLGSAPETSPVKGVKGQTQTQTQERRTSLLPWKLKGASDSKAGLIAAGSGVTVAERNALTPMKGHPHLNETTTPTLTLIPVPSHSSIVKGLTQENRSKAGPGSTPSKKASSDALASKPASATIPDRGPSQAPRKSRRYTFSFLSPSMFHRPKREKSNTAPASMDLGRGQNTQTELKGSVKGMESSGTDSTSTSIRTITQGSQTTLVPPSQGLYDLTTPGSSGSLSGRGVKSSVPMLRRLTAQEIATAGVPSQGDREDKRDSTPSLITNGSTATSSSSPRTPSFSRAGAEPFVHRPSTLKESFTDTSEEDSEGVFGGGRTCMHRRHEPSPLTHAGVGWGKIFDEDERPLHPEACPRFGSRPGTSSSTMTTATETSGSYLSFSSVPASTTSSSSTSRSESPSPILCDKQDRKVSIMQGGDGDEDIYTCGLCGHRSTSPLPLLTPSLMRDPDLEGMHPMFTVPLVTIPPSVFSSYSRSGSHTPTATQGERDAGTELGTGGRKSGRHMSVPVPADANASVLSMGFNQHLDLMHINGASVTTLTKARARARATNDKVIATTIAGLSPSPASPLQDLKTRPRPQTAPAGTGDVAMKFIEEAKAMRARQGGVDIDVLIGGDGSTKQKTGGGESKFKTVLKNLLKWGG